MTQCWLCVYVCVCCLRLPFIRFLSIVFLCADSIVSHRRHRYIWLIGSNKILWPCIGQETRIYSYIRNGDTVALQHHLYEFTLFTGCLRTVYIQHIANFLNGETTLTCSHWIRREDMLGESVEVKRASQCCCTCWMTQCVYIYRQYRISTHLK